MAPSHPPDSPRSGIPKRAHFVWFGQAFPWVNVLAVRSAALKGGFDEVVLHHDSDLSATPYYRELVETPGVRLRRLDPHEVIERCAPYVTELTEIYERLRTPATRSDLMRFALLYSVGGVYLDIDTVTRASFEPLCRDVTAFCGQERIIYPATVRNSWNPVVRAGAFARSRLRDLFRRLPHGWSTFRRFERWYPLAPNPAILGSAPHSPFIVEAIERMIRIPPERQHRPNVIGPHLLQQTVAGYRGSDLAVHPPDAFFPLGPEISEHWFRPVKRVELERVLSPSNRLVHWYASVRTKRLVGHIDPDYVRRNAPTQLFSSLALPFA